MQVVEATDANLAEFCEFLAAKRKMESQEVARRYGYEWVSHKPNYGFLLIDGGKISGVIGCFYSEREIRGRSYRFCNIADWFVEPEHRNESIKLLFAVLRQSGLTFTNFTPNRRAVEIYRGLGFEVVDPVAIVIPSLLYAPFGFFRSRSRLLVNDKQILEHLEDEDRRIFQTLSDTRDCDHLFLTHGAAQTYCILRFAKRKGIKFAWPIHISNPATFNRGLSVLSRWLVAQHRVGFALVEPRHLEANRPRLSISIKEPRPRMFRSDDLTAEDIDLLYSELTR